VGARDRPASHPACPLWSPVGHLRVGGQGQAARDGARWVASNAPSQASCQGHASDRCQVMMSRPLRAGRPASWISSARMVAPRAGVPGRVQGTQRPCEGVRGDPSWNGLSMNTACYR
jgi:hypothetical protein